jgi:hypothetical protein
LQLARIGGKLPVAVQRMFENPAIKKIGWGFDGSDFTKLTLTGIAFDKSSMSDIQGVCGVALGYSLKVSLKDAAKQLLGFSLTKKRQITCSDWSSFRLSSAQVHYAALDAWVPLRLHYEVTPTLTSRMNRNIALRQAKM